MSSMSASNSIGSVTSVENAPNNEIFFDKTNGSPGSISNQGPKMSSGSGFGSNFTPESLSVSIQAPTESNNNNY